MVSCVLVFFFKSTFLATFSQADKHAQGFRPDPILWESQARQRPVLFAPESLMLMIACITDLPQSAVRDLANPCALPWLPLPRTRGSNF